MLWKLWEMCWIAESLSEKKLVILFVSGAALKSSSNKSLLTKLLVICTLIPIYMKMLSWSQASLPRYKNFLGTTSKICFSIISMPSHLHA